MKIWGKSKFNEKEISLDQHINDVIEVFQYLREKVINPELEELINIVIEYHDAGKVIPYFQRRTIKNDSYQPFDVYCNIPHSLFSSLLVDERNLKESLTEKFNGDKEKAETYSKYILSAIAYHHWRETFYDIIEGNTDVFERLAKLVADNKKWSQIKENLKQVYSEVKSKGLIKPLLNNRWLAGLNDGIRFADYVVPPYQLYRIPQRFELNSSLRDWILISGFTMICDHFASYIERDAEENVSPADVEIQGIGYDKIRAQIEEELKDKIGDSYNPHKIWQFQYVEDYKNENTILLAPTGMGKTEFSFLWSNGVKFFYTLPLRTAVNQIFERSTRIFGEEKTGILHSDADVYIWGEGGESESMRVYELARQLSSPAILSTGDQFFPYALRPPSYEKIFAKLSYSRLIIDEIQAYDPKAAAIVVKFIEHIVQMGGKFLLMTATLPKFIKDEIDQRILDENRVSKNYKILNLFEKDSELAQISKHKIQVKIENYKVDQLSYDSTLIQEIVDKARVNGGSRVLVVMNTVKQAQALYDDLRKNSGDTVDVRLFHSRYTYTHRKTKEKDLEAFIGNNDISRRDRHPKILVATQVVEASLDLDADYLFTELAPWDSLIQRMGRVFREYRATSSNAPKIISRRYNQIEIPENVFILIYKGKNATGKDVFESGQGYVYDNELLKTTLKLLENISIEKEDLKKWNNGKKHETLFDRINAKPILLTELDKYELVDKLFSGLPDESNYLKSFYKMLQILDAGFMSDRKIEAQQIFREINDINVIAENKKAEFISDIKEFEENYGYDKRYSYTVFKKSILSKYLINVQISKVKEYITEFNHVPYNIRLNGEVTDPKILSRLNYWLSGVYFVNLEYKESKGLIGIKELSSFEIY